MKDSQMIEAIKHRVRLVSKMMRRGSHVVLLKAIHCYHANVPFPEIKVGLHTSLFIKHCFNPYPKRLQNRQWETTAVPHKVMDARLAFTAVLLVLLGKYFFYWVRLGK